MVGGFSDNISLHHWSEVTPNATDYLAVGARKGFAVIRGLIREVEALFLVVRVIVVPEVRGTWDDIGII